MVCEAGRDGIHVGGGCPCISVSPVRDEEGWQKIKSSGRKGGCGGKKEGVVLELKIIIIIITPQPRAEV